MSRGVLSGKTAVVTGGTGALGGAVVAALLAEGARVAVPYRKEGELERLRGDRSLDGHEDALSGGMLDLTDEAAVIAWAKSVARDLGRLDILVNAAGSFSGGTPVHETPWDVWHQQIDTNLKTAVLASRAVVPAMIRGGGGAIVNVSSRPAEGSGQGVGAYAASKRAILQLTEAMAAELRDQSITVNAILPSTIDTPANRRAMPAADPSRWVSPDEIARVVVFLAGPDARIVSGAHVPVYGKA
ncbi:MAG: SDR family NAD(P)-dependent oxidoreductase [Acidobacteriota bacterium]